MTKKVRVTGAGIDTYWYAKRVGEVFEVQDSLDWDDKYVLLDGVRFIDPEDCEEVTKGDEAMEIMVTKGRWWYEGKEGEVFTVHRVNENYVDASLDYETEAYEVLNEDGRPGKYVLTEDCVVVGEPVGAEPEPESTDVVNSPNHYTAGKVEVIEIIEQVTGGYEDPFVGYCVGNTQKYIARAPFKHESPLEDLRKAAKYLEFAIEHLERGQ